MPALDRIVIRGGVAALPLLLAAALLTGCSDDADCDNRAAAPEGAADEVAPVAAPERISGGSGGRSGGSGGRSGGSSTRSGGTSSVYTGSGDCDD
ncbi:hypothetical protein [Streptomyces specialis]|uniref:hypothetical protein n=1 Tax=Streptomyces specialis TaxID=498367 RepID=UPI00073F9D0F|nr:hypothetical protein [Streptomyces specialis]